jgi:hypothetical protein
LDKFERLSIVGRVKRAWWPVRLIGIGAVLVGVGVSIRGFDAIADGDTGLGWVIVTLAFLGAACGVAALLASRGRS